ncbi:ATP-binding protein [Streptomyces sp. NBC_00259]|uniref:ATP-binding protein n=1 Tax=Streptomyces sp. NBC_00259 TaxID=2903643 RepID=UPI002E27BCDD|nr:ATP-binding protein [Streptomyces sp. NBC_00259]
MYDTLHKAERKYFSHQFESVRHARDFASETLRAWDRLDIAEDIRLCLSELASNALTHADGPGRGFMVRLAADPAGIRLEVHDAGAGQPNTSRPNDEATSGRGLMIVEELADDWGIEKRKPFGKIVWSYFKSVTQGVSVAAA